MSRYVCHGIPSMETALNDREYAYTTHLPSLTSQMTRNTEASQRALLRERNMDRASLQYNQLRSRSVPEFPSTRYILCVHPSYQYDGNGVELEFPTSSSGIYAMLGAKRLRDYDNRLRPTAAHSDSADLTPTHFACISSDSRMKQARLHPMHNYVRCKFREDFLQTKNSNTNFEIAPCHASNSQMDTEGNQAFPLSCHSNDPANSTARSESRVLTMSLSSGHENDLDSDSNDLYDDDNDIDVWLHNTDDWWNPDFIEAQPRA